MSRSKEEREAQIADLMSRRSKPVKKAAAKKTAAKKKDSFVGKLAAAAVFLGDD